MPKTLTYDQLSDIAAAVDGKVHLEYSGRGMYGSRCVGISCGFSQFMKIGVLAVDVVGEETANLMASKATCDSLGRDTIIYFPGFTCSDPPEEKEEEDE